MRTRSRASLIGLVLLGLSGAVITFLGMYTVDEGHVGIVKTFGEAKRQDGPGLHFKLPLRDTVEKIDVRPRKRVEEMAAATSEQMPTTVRVSVNWTIATTSAIDVFRAYGGLEQFEERILDPRIREAVKAAVSKVTAEELTQNRVAVTALIDEGMQVRLTPYGGVTVDSVQIEDFTFPPRYLEAIEAKQRAKTAADQAVEDLRRQKTEAQAQVNTAEAERDANKARADGRAYAIEAEARAEAEAVRLRGVAEAETLELQAEVLQGSPVLVDYVRAKAWDGALPTTTLGSDPSLLVRLPDGARR